MEDQIPTCLVSHSAPSLHREKVQKEWGRLVDKRVFDTTNVQDWSHVAAKARSRGKSVHFGVVFWFCVQKNAELVDAKPVYEL